MSNILGRFSEYDIDVLGAEIAMRSLPVILGDYYHVNPNVVRNSNTNPFPGDNSNSGEDKKAPFKDIEKAYEKCYSGRGDGIVLHSQGTSSANTTSYLGGVLDWAKYNITVVGVAAGGFGGRARISTKETDLAYLIDFQGQNNRILNVHIGNYGSDAAALGCLKVSGARNTFDYSHFRGAGHATPGAVAHAADGSLGAHDLNLAASECYFRGCIFGDNAVLRAEANANIVLNAQMSKNTFEDCRTILYTNTSTQGAIAIHSANVLNGWIIFKNSTFTAWYPGVNPSVHTSMIIGANPNNCGILLQDC